MHLHDGGHAIRGVTIVRASLPFQIAAMRAPDFAIIAEAASMMLFCGGGAACYDISSCSPP